MNKSPIPRIVKSGGKSVLRRVDELYGVTFMACKKFPEYDDDDERAYCDVHCPRIYAEYYNTYSFSMKEECTTTYTGYYWYGQYCSPKNPIHKPGYDWYVIHAPGTGIIDFLKKHPELFNTKFKLHKDEYVKYYLDKD